MTATPNQASVLPRPGEDVTQRLFTEAATHIRRTPLVRDSAWIHCPEAEPNLFQLIAGILKPQT